MVTVSESIRQLGTGTVRVNYSNLHLDTLEPLSLSAFFRFVEGYRV